MQCCTCSKCVHLRCLLLSFSRFKTLGSSHFWSCPPCCVPASSGGPTTANTLSSSSDFFNLCISTVLCGPSGPFFQCSVPPRPHLQTSYPFSALFVTSLSAPSPPPHVLAVFLYSLLPFPPIDSLRVLQWNSGGLRAISTELLYSISSHPVDLIYIRKSNLNSCFSVKIPRYPALQSDRTQKECHVLPVWHSFS